MQVLLLCSNYAYFIIEKHLKLERDKHPPTGVRLSLHYIFTAVTDGQNVTVLMLVTVDLLL